MSRIPQKKVAASLLKCGVSRVRIAIGSEKDVTEALTRNDVRGLIEKGAIIQLQKKGQSRVRSNKIAKQKAKGRRKKQGSKKGAKYSRKTKKEIWISTVRPMRRRLKELRDSERVNKESFKKVYRMVKGGIFRNRKHMLSYMKDHEMLIKKAPKNVALKGLGGKNVKG